MIKFTAEYKDRDELLELGAKWDFSHWQWYVEDFEKYSAFSKWLGEKVVIADSLYILEGETICPYCGKITRLAAVAFGKYRENYLPAVYGEGYLNFLGGFEFVTGRLAEILKRNFPVQPRYTEAYGYKYLTNGCSFCGGVISDEYLLSESSPFNTDIEDRAKKLIIYEAESDCDVAVGGCVKWAANLQNAKKFAKPLPFSKLL